VNSCQLWLVVEEPVVITRDDQFVTIGQGTEPGVEVVDLFYTFTIHHEVAGMDQDIAGWENWNARLDLCQ